MRVYVCKRCGRVYGAAAIEEKLQRGKADKGLPRQRSVYCDHCGEVLCRTISEPVKDADGRVKTNDNGDVVLAPRSVVDAVDLGSETVELGFGG